MKMKKNIIRIIVFIMLFSAVSVSALDNNGIDLSIRLYNQRIYYPETEIQVLVEITNNTNDTYRFKSAQDRRYNLDFQATTLTNEPIRRSEQFIMAAERNQQVYYRDIDIEPGERFSFVEPLKDYLSLGKAGAYIVKASYFPELKNSGDGLESNLISFTVRPSAGNLALASRIDADTGAVLRREKLPPDEVVEYTIQARQLGQWNKFFLYLDPLSLMLEDPDAKRRYNRSSEEERLKMEEDYRIRLQSRTTRDEIVLVPIEYEIKETRYTSNMGTVIVIEKFQNPDFIEVKEFTYYLNRQDGIWTIGSYEVRNIGSE